MAFTMKPAATASWPTFRAAFQYTRRMSTRSTVLDATLYQPKRRSEEAVGCAVTAVAIWQSAMIFRQRRAEVKKPVEKVTLWSRLE
jgi:hypothetical protein